MQNALNILSFTCTVLTLTVTTCTITVMVLVKWYQKLHLALHAQFISIEWPIQLKGYMHKTLSLRKVITVHGSSHKRTPLGRERDAHNWSWPLRGISVKIWSLYGSWEKWSFVKAAVSRAVRLQQCPLQELPLYTKHTCK